MRCANDANCFALSEAVDGAAAGARVVFGVIVGTGTGGGVVVDRRVVTGANAIAGEWGHNPLALAAQPTRPAASGRARPATAAGPGASKRSSRDPASRTTTSVRAAPGRAVRRSWRAPRPPTRPPSAACSATRIEWRAGWPESSTCIDPDVIVLGGGMSNVDRLYANVPRLWAPYVFSDVVTTRLVKAAHGDSSGVRGAAWLWD